MEIVPHISDDTLERYAMESLRGSESEPLEELVAAMTSSAAKIREAEKS